MKRISDAEQSELLFERLLPAVRAGDFDGVCGGARPGIWDGVHGVRLASPAGEIVMTWAELRRRYPARPIERRPAASDWRQRRVGYLREKSAA